MQPYCALFLGVFMCVGPCQEAGSGQFFFWKMCVCVCVLFDLFQIQRLWFMTDWIYKSIVRLELDIWPDNGMSYISRSDLNKPSVYTVTAEVQ